MIQPNLWDEKVSLKFRGLLFAVLYAIPVLIMSVVIPLVVLFPAMSFSSIGGLLVAAPFWMLAAYFMSALAVGVLVGLYNYSEFKRFTKAPVN
ncbi:hypothetical protein J2W27_002546 [Variovorax boronicumulans]|uniref:hypothetical protein n=1 Tax=Variovorax boronicumulans TaxID=436515 RepID=UPI00277D574F|nr:hypothetical protein [Variovorax boronicumulans]MDP9910434.1 hypothetical protein [Variovorax boronicumulans]